MIKKRLLAMALGVSVAFGGLTASPSIAADNAKPLPHSLTKEEKAVINSGKYLEEKYRPFLNKSLRKPEGSFWMPAEFEKCEGICFSWAGYGDLLTKLITDSSKHAKVFVGASSYGQSGLKERLVAAGANGENITIVPASLDSVWIRDFGPFFIHTEAKKREIVDCLYNRPRPNDDKFPATMGQLLNVKVHPCKLILPGGNFQTDGHGVAILTDVVFDPSEGGDPNMTKADLEKYMSDYFGIKKVILLKKMKRDGTGHVDMFSKLLDDRNFIVGYYATPADGAAGNYDILNENAKVLENETNGLGEKFIVTRIPMPKYDGTSYSHTNSVFVNNLVMVPVYGKPTDEEALNVYKKLLPNHTIKGYDCRNIITANGAIHCVTSLVMADPIQVKENSVSVRALGPESLAVNFKVETKRRLNPEKITVHYSDDAKGPFRQAAAERAYDTYTANIEGLDLRNPVYYFITIEAIDGSTARMPVESGTTLTFANGK
ncbi:MAG: Peptidylarginine deiminase precursor [bacterium ADurb.Bin243]|nr:MAG: Peptidylarginine deiminase precursor [bacterium ADurb.Bin243]